MRQSFGYLLGRDPCVAFLFVLAGIKYLEARTPRDGTLLVCLACFLDRDAVLLQPVAARRACGAARAGRARRGAAGAGAAIAAPIFRCANGAVRYRSTMKLFAQGVPLAAVLFVLFPRLAGPMWGLPSDAARESGLSEQMSPGSISELSLSDAVAFRVDFDGAVPPPAQRYWRGPVMSRFDGREWIASDRRPRARPAAGRPGGIATGSRSSPTGQPGCSRSTCRRAAHCGGARARGTRRHHRHPHRRSADLCAQPGDAGHTLPQVSMLGRHVCAGGRAGRRRTENLQLPLDGRNANPRTVAFARELRAQHPDDIDYIRALLQWFRTESFYLHAGAAAASGRRSGRRIPVRQAARILRALRERLRRAASRRGYPGARGDGLPGRRDQSDRRLPDRPPIGCPCLGRGTARRQWRRFDPTGAVAPSRIERGLGGALPSSEFVPLLARLDEGWFKVCSSHGTRSTTIGAVTSLASITTSSARCGAPGTWTGSPPWQIAAIVAGAYRHFGVPACSALSWWRRRSGTARACCGTLCRRLANAGLPRTAARRSARVRRARLRALAGVGGRVRGHRRVVRNTPLRSAADRARATAARRRACRLTRAIEVLPAPRRCARARRLASAWTARAARRGRARGASAGRAASRAPPPGSGARARG